jgi:hypothetical protein
MKTNKSSLQKKVNNQRKDTKFKEYVWLDRPCGTKQKRNPCVLFLFFVVIILIMLSIYN